MPFYFFEWNDSNIDDIARHGVTQDELEEVVSHPDSTEESRSSDRFIAVGWTTTGRYLCCVDEMICQHRPAT